MAGDEPFRPYHEQVEHIQTAAAALSAGELIAKLNALSLEELRGLSRKIELAARTVRALVREKARAEQRDGRRKAAEQAFLGATPEPENDPERNGTVAVGAATGDESHEQA